MEKIISEQASWLGYKQAGLLKSIYNFTRVSVSTLLDGAHLGLSGEGILRPFYNEDLRKIDLGLFGSKNGTRIAASNPGIKIVASRFLPSQISGDVLAVLEGKKFHHITHVKAKNERLIEERDYPAIFTYNGDLDGRWLFQKMKKIQEEERQIVPNSLSEHEGLQIISTLAEVDVFFGKSTTNLPESAYQVTKKGHGRIFLINRDRISG